MATHIVQILTINNPTKKVPRLTYRKLLPISRDPCTQKAFFSSSKLCGILVNFGKHKTISPTMYFSQVIGSGRGVTGSFKDTTITEWLIKHNPTQLEFAAAVNNFTHSCAGYSIVTYILVITLQLERVFFGRFCTFTETLFYDFLSLTFSSSTMAMVYSVSHPFFCGKLPVFFTFVFITKNKQLLSLYKWN